ncbi:MAG: phosphoribosyltransferase [Chloroflexota bacterium]|nr:phosphoribosyltransferase [Chloroflexota bacterium]
MRFRDRADAGTQLGARLRDMDLQDPVVLGLPRGGVVVAAEVAAALGAPLDIIVARKLGVPRQPELAFGAVAPGIVVFQQDVVHAAGVQATEMDVAVSRESTRLQPLADRYRGGLPEMSLADRTVVIVDDGLATGATARAAVRSVRRAGPRAVIVAVPVAALETARSLRTEVDAVIALLEPHDFHAVGVYYDDFAPVADDVVRERLSAGNARRV